MSSQENESNSKAEFEHTFGEQTCADKFEHESSMSLNTAGSGNHSIFNVKVPKISNFDAEDNFQPKKMTGDYLQNLLD